MILEYGKRYIRRDGMITGIIRSTLGMQCFVDEDNRKTYSPNGKYHGDDLPCCDYDLISEYIESSDEQKLSDSLLTACKAAGVENPRYVAQDKDGEVFGYMNKPFARIGGETDLWDDYSGIYNKINHPPYADDWQDSLLEWVEPQGEPLADVLARHPDHFTELDKMIETDTDADRAYNDQQYNKLRDQRDALAEALREFVEEQCEHRPHEHSYALGNARKALATLTA